MRILIVDDEANLRRMLRSLLEEEGWRVEEASTAEAGLLRAEEFQPDTVLLDLVLPGMDGLTALPRLQEILPGTPIVMMSGEANLQDAVSATRQGAFHFLEKPLGSEAVLATLRGALEVSRARDLSRTLREEFGPGAELVGSSSAMEEVRRTIRKVGPTDARVLITGESGTGKELAATAIHGLSRRRGNAFVKVNSAAIPSELVESELFGHERGAFTGATARRRGRFELAHGGTLFLDEVGDLGAGAQAKLLRALESGVIQRVGGQEDLQVDVRVLSATNRDLRSDAGGRPFREDLLFRLEVVVLRMPALRERPEDIPSLVSHLRNRLRVRQGLGAPEIGDSALEVLATHGWPGNARELLNLMERLAILHPGESVGADEVRALLGPSRSKEARARDRDGSAGPPTPDYDADDERSLRERLDDYERDLLQGALLGAEGNVAEAARRLRTDRANLYRRMDRLGLR
ncbi:MAG: sigma-54 dependent transcriptional regulator [Gemmatimonadota bacterium]